MTPIRFLLPLLLVVALEPIRAIRVAPVSPTARIQYEFTFGNISDAGYFQFEDYIGDDYALSILSLASEFVLKTFNQKVGEGKGYVEVILSYESFAGEGIGSYPLAVASTIGNKIHLNSDYMLHYSDDIRAEFDGILYHESTHVWQWNGNGMAPSGLITGIADYMRLKAGWPSKSWPKRGLGLQWDEGYAITAYFLEYCDGLRNGFVADLNAMMKYTYSDSFFMQLLRKNVYELWNDYKSAYASDAPAPAPTAALALSPTAAPPYPTY
ncbi:hypothetical protein BT93_J0793 [Corymbia citriodora subsp. variegata]|nr:hypothetical protein BT93_J0793 [Corymbia citriodora subsp. variegata]